MGTTASPGQSSQLESFRNLRSMPSLTQPVRQPSTLGPLLDLDDHDGSNPAVSRMVLGQPNISSALKDKEKLPRPSRSRRNPAPTRAASVSSIRRMTSQLKSLQQQICVSSAVLKVMSAITMKATDIQENKKKINRLGSLDLDRIYARAQLGNKLSGLRQQVASLQGLLALERSPNEHEVLSVLITKPAPSQSQASPNIRVASQQVNKPISRPPLTTLTAKLPPAIKPPPTATPPSIARPIAQPPSSGARLITNIIQAGQPPPTTSLWPTTS